MAADPRLVAIRLAAHRAINPPERLERERRVDRVITRDAYVDLARAKGFLPDASKPVYESEEVAAPEGSGYDTLSDQLGAAPGTFAPIGATYITQTADGTLTNEQALSALATGLVKVTTTTGVLSTAVGNTDYLPVASPTATGTMTAVDLTTTGNATLGNGDGDIQLLQGHFKHKSAAPSIAVGVALGTGGSVSATVSYGTDQAGKITLVAGTTSLTTGIAATITFATARPDPNYALNVTKSNTTAGTDAVQYRVNNAGSTTWTISFGVAPASGATYVYFYQIVETTN